MTEITVKNMPLKVGHTLTVTGFPTAGTDHFEVNITSGSYIALHIDMRFKRYNNKREVICNSKLAEGWGEYIQHERFPFNYDELFKLSVSLTREEFVVVLSDASEIHFPNRLGKTKYADFSFVGGVHIRSFEIN